MENDNKALLVDKDVILQKIPGKGGWTYAPIPEIQQDKHAWFGWVKVCGSIDGYEIKSARLMPFGNGTLILPVKTEIRKAIGKNEGDTVHVTLFSQELPPVADDDFMICLKEEPVAYKRFLSLPKEEQRKITDWICAVRNDQIRVDRIAETINRLSV